MTLYRMAVRLARPCCRVRVSRHAWTSRSRTTTTPTACARRTRRATSRALDLPARSSTGGRTSTARRRPSCSARWATSSARRFSASPASRTEQRAAAGVEQQFGVHERATSRSDPWRNFYGVISLANDGLQALDRGVQIGTNGATTTPARAPSRKFMQGVAHGYLALHVRQGGHHRREAERRHARHAEVRRRIRT